MMLGMRPVRILLAVAVAALVPAVALAAVDAAPLPGVMTTKAPWGPNNGALLHARLAAIGLPALGAEGAALHIHQHIDLFVRGRRVGIPPGIGIDAQGRFISDLHTHDGSGIVHVEAPRVRAFTLGQFFDVWGLRFTARCIGGYCTGNGNRLSIWVNGSPWTGDPRRVVLHGHDEYVIAFGTPAELPRTIAKTYAFPHGL